MTAISRASEPAAVILSLAKDLLPVSCFRSPLAGNAALCLQLELETRNSEPYVGTFRIKYPPTNPKIRSGDQAANTGGSWLTFPMDSNSPDTTM